MKYMPAGPPSWRGKVKDVYDAGDYLVIRFSDRVSAFDEVLRDEIPDKGVYLNSMSAMLLRESSSIYPNHLLEVLDERSMKVVKARRIDLEFVVRGYLYGSAWRAYSSGNRVVSGVSLPPGLSMAEELPEPILTPTTKSQVGHDEEITRSEAIGSGIISEDEWRELEEASQRLYEFYSSSAKRRGLLLADAKFEFGRAGDGLIQIDEPPTHDSARIWPADHYRPGEAQERMCLDKEFLRAYLRAAGRPERLPPLVVEQVALRVKGAYLVMAGEAKVDELGLMGLEEVMRAAGGELRGGGSP